MAETYALFPQIHPSDIDTLLSVSTPQQCQPSHHFSHHLNQQQPQMQLQQEFLYDPMLYCYFQPQRSASTSFDMANNTIYPITPMPQHNLFYDTVPMFQPSPHSISQSSIGSPSLSHSECFNNQQPQDSIKSDFRSMMTPPEEYEIPLFFDTNQVESINEDFSDQKNSLDCITENHPPSQSVVDTDTLSDFASKRKVCVSKNKKDSACTSPPSPPSAKGSPGSVGSFQCDFPNCTKTFTRTYNLKSHYRTHTDERPFKCTQCPKSFARQHDRNRHEKLHGGSKPYLCEYCEKGFARQDALNRHLKRDKKSRESRRASSSYADHGIPPCVLMKIQRHPISKQDSD